MPKKFNSIVCYLKKYWLLWVASIFYILLFKWLSPSISFESNIQSIWSLIESLRTSDPSSYIHHLLVANIPPVQSLIFLILTPLTQWLGIHQLNPNQYFFLKSPSLIFHLGLMFLIFRSQKKIFTNTESIEKNYAKNIISFFAIFFWPAVLYISACFFSYDNLSYIFIFLALLSYKKKSWQQSGFYFSLACSSSILSFYLLPVLLMLHSLELPKIDQNRPLIPKKSPFLLQRFRKWQKIPISMFFLSFASLWIILNSPFFLYDPILFAQNILNNFSVFQYSNLNGFNFYNLFSANYIPIRNIPEISLFSYALLLAGLAVIWNNLNCFQNLLQNKSIHNIDSNVIYPLKILSAFTFLWILLFFAPGSSERSFTFLFPLLIFLTPVAKNYLCLQIILGILFAINQDMVVESYFGNKLALQGVIPIFSAFLQLLGIIFCLFQLYRLKTCVSSPDFLENSSNHSHSVLEISPLAIFNTIAKYLSCCFERSYRSTKNCPSLPRIHILLLFLMWVFIFFSNQIQLGSKHIPMSSDYLKKPINIHINSISNPLQNHKLQDVWIFIRNDSGSLFIECPSTNESLEHITTGDSFYMWRKLSFAAPCEGNTIWLKPSSKNPEPILISEIHLRSSERQIIQIDKICDSQNLCTLASTHPFFDEPPRSELELSYYGGTYFDEIYYVRSIVDLFEFRYPYESTHPHLAKFFTTAFVKFTKMSPYYWRLPNVFFGSLIPLVIFFIAFTVFRNLSLAWSSLWLSAWDPARVALSRIFTIDAPVCFWILLSVYFLIKFYQKIQKHWFEPMNPSSLKIFNVKSFLYLFTCSLSLGLALSTKWIALFTLVITIFLVFLSILLYSLNFSFTKNRIFNTLQIILAIAIIVGIPPFLYWLSFSPLHWTMNQNFTWEQFYQWNYNMWDYHRNLKATHPYASRFYTWPFMQLPMAFYIHLPYENSMKQNIFVVGNPILWWLSIPSCFYILFRPKLWERSLVLIVLLFFGGHFLSWILSSRITFIYHYLVSSCFACVLISHCFNDLSQRFLKQKTLGLIAWFLVIFAAGILFFPAAMGIIMPASFFANFNAIFDGWYF